MKVFIPTIIAILLVISSCKKEYKCIITQSTSIKGKVQPTIVTVHQFKGTKAQKDRYEKNGSSTTQSGYTFTIIKTRCD